MHEARSWRRRGRLVAAAVAAAVLVVGGCSDDGGGGGGGAAREEGGAQDSSSPRRASLPPEVSGQLDPEAKELIDALQSGQTRTFHARYRLTSAEAPDSVVDAWRGSGGRLRQDSRGQMAGVEVITSSYQIDGSLIGCMKHGDAPWTCTRQGDATEDAAGVFVAAAADLDGVDVTEVGDQTVGGIASTCYEFSAGTGSRTLCVSSDGVATRMAIVEGEQRSEMELVEYSESVSDDVFELPAELS